MSTDANAARPIRRALISVYDKTGIVEFALALHSEFGVEIISTGGTAKTLRHAGIPVTLIEDLTGSPEMLDGRVKTLHPKIHAAILADRDNPEHMRQLAEQGIEPIDMVVVNLYPFEKTVADPHCAFEQAIEMIDIGGVALLRAAAKNHRDVLVAAKRSRFPQLLSALRGDEDQPIAELRRTLAQAAFMETAHYDASIMTWISTREVGRPSFWGPLLGAMRTLRYGENPHQEAETAREVHSTAAIDLTVADLVAEDRFGNTTAMSYNNFLDADAALGLCAELARAELPGCVFVKHSNPCGVAVSEDPISAYRDAYLGDPNAAMGGILAMSQTVTPELAQAVLDSLQTWGAAAGASAFFVEVWLAPDFEPDAVQVIRAGKKWGENVRLLAIGDLTAPPDPGNRHCRSIAGGLLLQTPDLPGLNAERWKLVTQRSPTDAELADLRLAWLICKHTRSNAISVVKDGMLIGNGAGQMSRVMSCRIATWLAQENGHAAKLAGSAAASDAFFPFADGPRVLLDAGVTALIQPGGSKRDEETIKLCDERDVAMIFTGTRHFRH